MQIETMNMRISIFAAAGLLLLGTLSARAQESADNGVLPFLGLATDARTAGLAGAGSTLGDNASAIYGNAASALTGDKKAGIGLFTGPWTSDFKSSDVLLGASGYYNIGGKNGILAGFRRIAGPDIELTDDLGLPAGTTHSSEWTLDLGYGHLFADRWAVAVTAHYVHSDLGFDDPSNGVMFGLHAAYKGSFRRPDAGRWSVGLSLLDCGPELKMGSANYPLPMRLRLGGSVDRRFNRNHELAAALDLNYQLQPEGIFAASLGAEYTFLRHGVVRAGYCVSSAMNNSGNYGTIGCGVLAGPARIDFAYRFGGGEHNPLNRTIHLSAAVLF